MSDPKSYHVYRLNNAHPGAVGECLLFITVTQESAGWWGTYCLLTNALEGSLTCGNAECQATMVSSLNIADPYQFILSETLNLARSEIADRLQAAVSEYGAESVFRVLPEFSEVGFQEIAGAYMRGVFNGKWDALRRECRSGELYSHISQLLNWTPSFRRGP